MAELNTSAEKNSRHKSNRQPVRVDLTAMVDLAFLLITFFMLTTTLQKQEAMPIAMPDKGDAVSDPGVPMSRTLTLCLGSGNKVLSYMGTPDVPVGHPVVSSFGKNSLRFLLISTKTEIREKTGKDMIVLLKPGNHSIYNDMVSAIDEINIARISRYAIVDISPADEKLLKRYNSY